MELIVERRHRGHGQPPSPRRLRRRLLLAGAGALLLAAVSGYFWLLPSAKIRYRAWHQHRALTQARAFARTHDGANASLALQVALRDDAASPEVWRVAADLLEQAGNAQAISVRKDILRLPASTADDRLALVVTALRFGDLTNAADALRELPADVRSSTAGRRVAAQFALATGQPALAHALLDSLVRDHPGDTSLQFALAALRLRLPDPTAAATARQEVEVFARQPALQLPALRELTLDALFRREHAAAVRYAAELTAAPGATFTDELTAANVALLAAAKAPETVIAGLTAHAAAEADHAAQFASWLLAQGRTADTLAFFSSLPATIARTPSVRSLEANAAAAAGDWPRLGELLRTGAWGPMAPEIVDLAFSAHTVDERSRPELRHSLWQEAVRTAGHSLSTLRILQRLAARWHWDAERLDTLEAITVAFPRELAAHESLARERAAAKSSAELQRALFRWMEADPGNQRVRNDWALLALVREPTDQPDRPKSVAAELYRSEPANPYFITAHAFALAQLGQTAAALALVEQLAPADRDYPPRAPYLATVYAAAGRTEAARLALDLTVPESLLPEELALVKTTRARVSPALPVPPRAAPARVAKPVTVRSAPTLPAAPTPAPGD